MTVPSCAAVLCRKHETASVATDRTARAHFPPGPRWTAGSEMWNSLRFVISLPRWCHHKQYSLRRVVAAGSSISRQGMAESDSDDSVGTGPLLEVTEYPGNGWCSDDDFLQHCHSFTPCVFRNTQSFRLKNLNPFHSNQITSSISQKLVEVSCSPTADFHGHPLSRASTKLSFAQFLAAFQARSDEEVALVTGCDAHVYLSQCCVYSVNRHEVDVPEMEHFALNVLPPIIHRTDLQSINLWANVHASFSGLHYDANHNVLFVIQGRKTVWLFPPSATDMLQPYSAYVESPNHSHRSSQELLAALGSSTRLQGMSVELSAGHALFIPEGWWHMVDSVERTVALNYWFLSPLQKLLQQARHMSPYVLRASAHALTEQRVASSLKAFRPPRSSLNKRPFDASSSGGDLRLTLDQEEEFAAIPSAPSPASASVSVASLATNVRPMTSSESDCDSFQSTKRRRCCSDDNAITCDADSDGTVLMWQQRLLPACHGADQFEHQWLSAARENPSLVVQAIAQHCTPLEAAWVLSRWDRFSDDNEQMGEVFDAFFALLGTQRATEVHNTLMQRQAAWRENEGAQAVSLTIGK